MCFLRILNLLLICVIVNAESLGSVRDLRPTEQLAQRSNYYFTLLRRGAHAPILQPDSAGTRKHGEHGSTKVP